MRSSVSAILSDPAPDTTMSFPDYGQTAADHARLLVLCQQVGHQLPAEQFQAAVAALRGVAEVRVADKVTSENVKDLTLSLYCYLCLTRS